MQARLNWRVPFPARPTGIAQTIVMFTTHPRQPGGAGAAVQPSAPVRMPREDIAAVTLHFLKNDQASAANGLRVYTLGSDGITWIETSLNDDSNPPTDQIGANAQLQIPALVAPTTRRVRLVVPHLFGVAVEYTTGAAAPSAGNWDGWIGVERHMAVQL